MSTTPPTGPQGGPRPKERDDDARGAEPGRFGQSPFVPTDEMRQQARTFAKAVPVSGEHLIAAKMGISRSTLRRHFSDDMLLGRAEMILSIGAQVVNRALDGESKTAKGDLDAQKFVLARMGYWSTKVEHSGRDGAPIETIDLSGMTPAALREYGRQAAIQQGLDPDEAIGPAIDDE